MTFRLLGILLGVFCLIALPALAKDATPDAPKSVKVRTQVVQDELKEVVGPGGVSVEYHGENAKFNEKVSDVPEFSEPETRANFLVEGFEAATFPPTSWTEIILNSSYNWKKQTVGTAHSGTGAADVEYDPSLANQDEWLVSPALNFGSATANLKVEFWWNMSYYWGVTPYDNYDYELWISTDGGGTWSTKLWDESGEGVFSNFTWYKETISLAGYVGQTNVKLAWRYVGADGAQAALDDIIVTDDADPIGRCCYGAGLCVDTTQTRCNSLSGVWNSSLTCATACPTGPANDMCANAIGIGDVTNLPFDPTNGTLDGPGGYITNRNIWYLYTASCTGTATVSLCGSSYDTRVRVWPNDVCPPSGTQLAQDDDACDGITPPGSGLASITTFPCVAGNKYLIEVAPYSASTTIGTGYLTTSCAVPTPGDNCASPYVITVGLGDLPYTASGLNNCGRVNDYSNTCMGSYDGGEDMIIQLNLTDAVVVDLTLNPNGTTYSAMAIDNVCPLDIATGSCLGFVGTSSGSAKMITGLNLAAGTYYIMVDTWPSPNCIPNFSITIAGAAPPPPNDACANAIAIGDVSNLPFSTVSATFDGPGGYIVSPNIWYKYTASCDGALTASLCGSGYDTRIRVWDGATCPPTLMLGQDDDFCDGVNPPGSGLASQVQVQVVTGNQYLIEVGGYTTNTGTGVLSTSCTVLPPNNFCQDVTPVTLVSGVPVTFTGDNTGAINQCASFPGGHVWEAFTLTECSDVTLDYCGTTPFFENAWLNLGLGCPCASFTPAGAFNTTSCGDGNVSITWLGLTPGTYYYPVLSEPGAMGPYTINVVATTTAAYCAASGTTCDEYISKVQVGTINNSSTCGNYVDYTSISTEMVKTVGYPITVTNGLPYTSDQCGVWVDWNQDLCFDATEKITMTGGPASFTGTITPPMAALPGDTRMRVRITYTGAVAPCGATTYGEVEDYTIEVIDIAPRATCAPDPQYVYFSFAVVPIIDNFYVGMFNSPYTAADVDLTSLTINGSPATVAVVEPSNPGFLGAVVKADLPANVFLPPYGALFDANVEPFTVAGQFTDLTPFSITGDVVIIGRSSPSPNRFITPETGVVLVPGDFDESGMISIADAVALINFIFAGASAPANQLIGDADCSANVSIADAVYLINYIFAAGAAPCVP